MLEILISDVISVIVAVIIAVVFYRRQKRKEFERRWNTLLTTVKTKLIERLGARKGLINSPADDYFVQEQATSVVALLDDEAVTDKEKRRHLRQVMIMFKRLWKSLDLVQTPKYEFEHVIIPNTHKETVFFSVAPDPVAPILDAFRDDFSRAKINDLIEQIRNVLKGNPGGKEAFFGQLRQTLQDLEEIVKATANLEVVYVPSGERPETSPSWESSIEHNYEISKAFDSVFHQLSLDPEFFDRVVRLLKHRKIIPQLVTS